MNATNRRLVRQNAAARGSMMKASVVVAWIAFGVALGGAPDHQIPLPPAALAITHVTVTDTAGGPVLADRTVVVRNAGIVAIAPNACIPKGAAIVNARASPRETMCYFG